MLKEVVVQCMQARNLSDSTDVVMQALIEQLMQEWKVGDFAVAESIFKSRQRQLKQKGGAQMRQKMQVGMPTVCEKKRQEKKRLHLLALM